VLVGADGVKKKHVNSCRKLITERRSGDRGVRKMHLDPKEWRGIITVDTNR